MTAVPAWTTGAFQAGSVGASSDEGSDDDDTYPWNHLTQAPHRRPNGPIDWVEAVLDDLDRRHEQAIRAGR